MITTEHCISNLFWTSLIEKQCFRDSKDRDGQVPIPRKAFLELDWLFFENGFPVGTKYAGWKVPDDTSTMTTRRLMASPCLNNSDSSRQKSLAKVLEDGADF